MGRLLVSRFGVPCCLLAGFAAAALSARPYAGAWNDGSRLAAVEAIADHGTLAIDDSIFVRVPVESVQTWNAPYPAANADLVRHGTKDKLFIGGRYYSDKPYVVSILMAGLYRGFQMACLPTASERPDLFCRAMTIATSGLAFAVAIACMYQLGMIVGLTAGLRFIWIASFAIGTVTLTYTWHVNNHIMLLAVMAATLLLAAKLSRDPPERRRSSLRLIALGSLAGIGYNLDLGAGPIMVGALLAFVAYQCQNMTAVALVLLTAAPWLLAHHAINYAIGGAWKPINAVAEYMNWPGSPFSEANMTGLWQHQPGKLLVYALALLFGKHGFIGHNLALFMLFPAAFLFLHRRVREHAEIIFGIAWCAGVWLTYAVFSNNYGGACCSVRWFVPFLAPSYFVLAVLLREYPVYRGDFMVLSAWGAVLGAIMWCNGPWIMKMVPWFWPIQVAALASWGVYRYIHSRRLRQTQPVVSLPIQRVSPAA